LGGTLQHIATLVVAESPVEAHREFLEKQREEEERRLILESRRTQDEELMSQVDDLERQQFEVTARRALAVQRSVLFPNSLELYSQLSCSFFAFDEHKMCAGGREQQEL
jgi:hypothetical protein